MQRLIVLSATYRQSSRVTPELHERDPFNRLLARGPRLRLEAETVRDNALAISGLLQRKIGGPSVFPYQPEGVWFNPYSNDKWTTSANGDQYRRGLYTFWRRHRPLCRLHGVRCAEPRNLHRTPAAHQHPVASAGDLERPVVRGVCGDARSKNND